MARWDDRSVAKNSAVLMMMYIAKLIFPLITLPYLTRVLSADCYGAVAYVRAVMVYMEVLVDFGFVLSATKRIVDAADDKAFLGVVTGNTIAAKLLLSAGAFVVLMVLTLALPILRAHALYTVLSFAVVLMSVFLVDFLFRGLARMHVVTMRFVVMRGIATALTFAVVRRDSDMVLIPVVDLMGVLVAIALVARETRKCGVVIKVSGLRDVLARMRESSVYFVSTMADTSFNVLSTVILGVMLSASDVAYWAVCLQLIGVGQAFYAPIMESVYPAMVQRKDWGLIMKLLKLFLPLIGVGCCLAYVLAPWGLVVVGGRQYAAAAGVYRRLIPVLLLSFPVMLLGWPTLGAIGQQAKTSKTAVITVIAQAIGFALLAVTGTFTLVAVAILRSATELLLLTLRLGYCWKYRGELLGYKGSRIVPQQLG